MRLYQFGFLVVLSFCFVTASYSNASTGDDIVRTFSKGTYRQEGSCTKLERFGNDEKASCQSHIGVIATEYDLPQFVFITGEGSALFFVSDSPAVFSNGNRSASYKISKILDLASKRFFLYEGECTVEIAYAKEEIHCITWVTSERTKIALEGNFIGNGAWLYTP